ncbi:hypothetical protein VPHPS15B6_0094 [Vibrio phage PS15B-6]
MTVYGNEKFLISRASLGRFKRRWFSQIICST